jgi:hypothetical protein
MTPEETEILQAINFYNARGWSWVTVVGYLSAKANGLWPPKRRQYSRAGRPRQSQHRPTESEEREQ